MKLKRYPAVFNYISYLYPKPIQNLTIGSWGSLGVQVRQGLRYGITLRTRSENPWGRTLVSCDTIPVWFLKWNADQGQSAACHPLKCTWPSLSKDPRAEATTTIFGTEACNPDLLSATGLSWTRNCVRSFQLTHLEIRPGTCKPTATLCLCVCVCFISTPYLQKNNPDPHVGV